MIFGTITDIERLPEWNGAIERLIDRPGRADHRCDVVRGLSDVTPLRGLVRKQHGPGRDRWMAQWIREQKRRREARDNLRGRR